jgi:hypothetical protein
MGAISSGYMVICRYSNYSESDTVSRLEITCLEL